MTPKDYKLNTVTYGTDAAPFLSIRTILQCAKDNSPSDKIENIIRKGFYVDDLLYGADSIPEAKKQIEEISNTLQQGCFPLTKWASNEEKILENISTEKKITSFITENKNTQIKLLGVQYDFQ